MADMEMIPVVCGDCGGSGVLKGRDTGNLCSRCRGAGGYVAPRFTGRMRRADIQSVHMGATRWISYDEFLAEVPELELSASPGLPPRFHPRPDCDQCGGGPMRISGDRFTCGKCGATKLRTQEGGAEGSTEPELPEVSYPKDAPYCMQCGTQMVRSGSMYACPNCGSILEG
jgi:ribosomal protein S27AE